MDRYKIILELEQIIQSEWKTLSYDSIRPCLWNNDIIIVLKMCFMLDLERIIVFCKNRDLDFYMQSLNKDYHKITIYSPKDDEALLKSDKFLNRRESL